MRSTTRGRLVVFFTVFGLAAAIVVAAPLLVAEDETVPDAVADEVAMVASTGEAARYWPRWRGPSGQGQVAGGGYVDTWSQSENVLWKTPVPGSGNSSPIVWDDRIFVTTAYDGGKRRSLLAFRRTDGEKLWETFAPEASPEAAHGKNGHASSTPTTDGERVYAWFGNHGVVAVDFAGKVVWHRGFGAFEAYHGTASSPLLHGGRLIVAQDHRGGSGSFVTALDAKTGEVVWRTPRDAKVGWNTPVAVRVGDHDEIILSSMKKVTAYDPENGEELWWAGGNTFEAIPTPVVGHGHVYCSSGRAGPTLAIRPGGRGDVTSSRVTWSTPKGSPFVPSTVLDGDYLFMVNDMAAIASCFDARTGEVRWQGRLGKARREGFSASPVALGGKIFFTNDDGQTFVLESGPEFKLLHTNRLGERVLASPALVDGRWYFRTERHLLAIGAG